MRVRIRVSTRVRVRVRGRMRVRVGAYRPLMPWSGLRVGQGEGQG